MPAEVQGNALPPIAIIGAGGLGREVLMLLHQVNQAAPRWQLTGFYDDNKDLPASINGFAHLGTLTKLPAAASPLALALAIADPGVKARISQSFAGSSFYFPALLHPQVSNAAYQFNQIGDGSIICQATVLTTNIVLGRQVLVNLGCTIGHDVVLGDYCSLMPHVNLGGGSQLGAGVYAGTNATVLPGVRVGANVIIGAGAVVTRDLPANCTAVGVPAKVIKEHDR